MQISSIRLTDTRHRKAHARRDGGLDPVSWTSSERWIRCPDRWQKAPSAGLAGSSLTSSRLGAVRLVFDEGKTIGAVARELDLTAPRRWPIGSGTRGRIGRKGKTGLTTEEREELATPAQRESRATDGARHPKKSRGLLREAPSVKFAWIAAEKAEFRIATLCRVLQVSPQRVLCLAHAPGIGPCAATTAD